MGDWQVDLSDYNDADTDEAKIARSVGVPCRICESVFRRVRITWRYCAWCHKGFCEGEHGTFAIGGRGSCIQCGRHA
jgi:hypothetical protein